MEKEKALKLISEEHAKATDEYADFNSLHEGYAVLLEEVNELWVKIKTKNPHPKTVAKEATQVAAMALRILTDCVKY